MINVDYSNNKIRVETKIISNFLETPLKLSICSHVNKKELWSTTLKDNWWAEFPNNEMNDVIITDINGDIIIEKKWDVLFDGSDIYKFMYLYCKKLNKNNIKPKGVAIGTHDGLFGEWVPCVLKDMTDATLIEASLPQFNNLVNNFKEYSNVKFLNTLVSIDGKPIEFFEGGLGYTNSVVERVIRGWEKEEINSTIKESTSINSIINNGIDWLHLDVEGYDAKIIMAIDIQNLPKLIIFEYENLESIENEMVRKYLTDNGYFLDYKNVSCIALKN
jgi:hypothetical protein